MAKKEISEYKEDAELESKISEKLYTELDNVLEKFCEMCYETNAYKKVRKSPEDTALEVVEELRRNQLYCIFKRELEMENH